jgi:hypothetical protein
MSQDFKVYINVIIYEYRAQFLCLKSEIVPGPVRILWEQDGKVWMKR